MQRDEFDRRPDRSSLYVSRMSSSVTAAQSLKSLDFTRHLVGFGTGPAHSLVALSRIEQKSDCIAGHTPLEKKMKPRVFRRYLLALVSLPACRSLGCATFRSQNRTPIPTWPLQSSERKPSINLNVTAKAWVNKTEIPADKMQSNFLGEWRSQASKAFEESTLFSEVKLSSDDITDMQADIDIERRVEYSETLAFITGFTLGLSSVLIPQKKPRRSPSHRRSRIRTVA